MRQAVYSELAVPYVRASSSEYLSWTTDVTNNNYTMMSKLMDQMVALTSGIRRNNADAMLSGRQKIAPIFYAGQHTTYQRLLLRDMLQRAQAPAVVQRHLRETTSYNQGVIVRELRVGHVPHCHVTRSQFLPHQGRLFTQTSACFEAFLLEKGL